MIGFKEFVNRHMFPNRCVFCDETGSGIWCSNCLKSIPFKGIRRRCLDDGTLVLSVFEYSGDIKKALHNFKFEGFLSIGKVCSELLARLLPKSDFLDPLFIAMPTHKKRIRNRGFHHLNHLFNDYMKRYGYFLHHPVIRCVETPPMFGLTKKERQDVLLDCFDMSVTIPNIYNREIIILDDVVTSGSSILELVSFLKGKGAKRLSSICFADVIHE